MKKKFLKGSMTFLAIAGFVLFLNVAKVNADDLPDGSVDPTGSADDYDRYSPVEPAGDYDYNAAADGQYGDIPESSSGSETGNSSNSSESYNYLPGTDNYIKDNNTGQYYFAADDGTYRNSSGEEYPYEMPNPSTAATGESPTSSVVDGNGNPVFDNGDGSFSIYKNGEYVKATDEDMKERWYNQSGQEIAQDGSGNWVDVQRDSDGKTYTMGADGKTKWHWDENGKLSATGENGEKLTLDANGNVVSPSGSALPSGSSMAPRGIPAGSFSGNTNTRTGTGTGNWLTSFLGMNGSPGAGGAYYGSGATGMGSYGTTGSGGILGSILGGGSSYGTGGGMLVGGSGYGGGTGSYYGAGASSSGWNPANYVSTGLPTGSIYNIIEGIVFWILAIFGFICIIGFVISGIMYLLAAGDEKSQEKAKRAMYYSITGVIVGLVGLVIIFAVNALLRGASYF